MIFEKMMQFCLKFLKLDQDPSLLNRYILVINHNTMNKLTKLIYISSI